METSEQTHREPVAPPAATSLLAPDDGHAPTEREPVCAPGRKLAPAPGPAAANLFSSLPRNRRLRQFLHRVKALNLSVPTHNLVVRVEPRAVGQNFLDRLKWYASAEGREGRKPFKSPEEKLQVVVAVLRGEMTQVEAARRLEMSQTTIAKWQKQFLEGAHEAARAGRERASALQPAGGRSPGPNRRAHECARRGLRRAAGLA